jgi:predicted nuclease of predicted toxin-antitoxin system
MKFLVDEDLSPAIAARLPLLGHAASHVAHVGLASTKDRALWQLALERDEIVITANARDFLKLATVVDIHPGLIVLREGALDRNQQWDRVQMVLTYLDRQGITDLVNLVVEVLAPGRVVVRQIPGA